eukprot:m.52744 g.52744  ORF g.52744 m.52744 type:complete len:428 (+) comp11332_c0_seq4:201-1484(+)
MGRRKSSGDRRVARQMARRPTFTRKALRSAVLDQILNLQEAGAQIDVSNLAEQMSAIEAPHRKRREQSWEEVATVMFVECGWYRCERMFNSTNAAVAHMIAAHCHSTDSSSLQCRVARCRETFNSEDLDLVRAHFHHHSDSFMRSDRVVIDCTDPRCAEVFTNAFDAEIHNALGHESEECYRFFEQLARDKAVPDHVALPKDAKETRACSASVTCPDTDTEITIRTLPPRSTPHESSAKAAPTSPASNVVTETNTMPASMEKVKDNTTATAVSAHEHGLRAPPPLPSLIPPASVEPAQPISYHIPPVVERRTSRGVRYKCLNCSKLFARYISCVRCHRDQHRDCAVPPVKRKAPSWQCSDCRELQLRGTANDEFIAMEWLPQQFSLEGNADEQLLARSLQSIIADSTKAPQSLITQSRWVLGGMIKP